MSNEIHQLQIPHTSGKWVTVSLLISAGAAVVLHYDHTVAAAALPPEPFITNGVEAGGVRALNLDKGLQNFMLSGWIANTSWVGANRDTITKFLTAMREAGDMVNRRPMPPEVADSLSKYTKIPSAVILHLTYPPHDGDVLTLNQIQPLIDAAAKYGVIDKSFPATEIMFRP